MTQQHGVDRQRFQSTRGGVERVLVLIFVTIRVTGLAQAAVGVTMRSVTISSRPTISMLCLAALAVESIVVGSWMLRTGGVTARRAPVPLDIGATVIALVVAAHGTEPEHKLEPWSMGVYSVSISTALLIGLAVRPFLGAMLGSTGLVLAYLSLVLVPSSHPWSGLATAGTNASVYPSYTIAAWLVAKITRNLAEAAEEARRRTAELERDRSRATVHDLLPFLRPHRFAGSDDRGHALMAKQAEAKYRQMRAFVDGTEGRETVDDHLRAVIGLHPRLNVSTTVDSGCVTRLAQDVLGCLLRAVDTALANVEQNTADSPTVRVTATSAPDTITVTVRDDGPGFDPATVTPGYGIAQILTRQLHAVDGHGTVTSRPGAGTEVRIVVPRRPP